MRRHCFQHITSPSHVKNIIIMDESRVQNEESRVHNEESGVHNEKSTMTRSGKVVELADTSTSIGSTYTTTTQPNDSTRHHVDAKKNKSYDSMKVATMLEKLQKVFNGRAVPFPIKLMKIIDTSVYHDIVAWSHDGRTFMITDIDSFVENVLSVHYKGQAKFSSFQRKLYRWGFKKKEGSYKKCYVTFMHKMRCYSTPNDFKKINATMISDNSSSTSALGGHTDASSSLFLCDQNPSLPLTGRSSAILNSRMSNIRNSSVLHHHLETNTPLLTSSNQQFQLHSNNHLLSFRATAEDEERRNRISRRFFDTNELSNFRMSSLKNSVNTTFDRGAPPSFSNLKDTRSSSASLLVPNPFLERSRGSLPLPSSLRSDSLFDQGAGAAYTSIDHSYMLHLLREREKLTPQEIIHVQQYLENMDDLTLLREIQRSKLNFPIAMTRYSGEQIDNDETPTTMLGRTVDEQEELKESIENLLSLSKKSQRIALTPPRLLQDNAPSSLLLHESTTREDRQKKLRADNERQQKPSLLSSSSSLLRSIESGYSKISPKYIAERRDVHSKIIRHAWIGLQSQNFT